MNPCITNAKKWLHDLSKPHADDKQAIAERDAAAEEAMECYKSMQAKVAQLTADLEEARTNAYDQPRDNRGRFRSPEDETASAQEREDGTETQVTTYG